MDKTYKKKQKTRAIGRGDLYVHWPRPWNEAKPLLSGNGYNTQREGPHAKPPTRPASDNPNKPEEERRERDEEKRRKEGGGEGGAADALEALAKAADNRYRPSVQGRIVRSLR